MSTRWLGVEETGHGEPYECRSPLDPLLTTPEKTARLRELPRLIANENDPEKMKTLALELQRLLNEEAAECDLGRQAN